MAFCLRLAQRLQLSISNAAFPWAGTPLPTQPCPEPCFGIAAYNRARAAARALLSIHPLYHLRMDLSALYVAVALQSPCKIPHWAFSVPGATTSKFRFQRKATPTNPHCFISL